ncbi:Type 1 glutamine amidotransferase-like domain-containing protein [Pontibacillus salicampi]|uniref:Type 1 glutamine amidotransferase-like domain-containing protein n=1 Tax=Pontibacillus salicampi TaxID=1449801 RepID=A0ABV6LM15_9BACI
MNIIAMGGGGFSQEPDNPLLDRYVLNQSPQLRPKICFIPTASGDSEEYIQNFYSFFQKEECEPTHLSLLHPEVADKESFLLSQDIIYVGGGNTRNLVALWKEWELDKILYKAWEKDIILAGISAGGICWFEEGVTDSVPNQLTRTSALGFLKGSFCPHYDGENERQKAFKQLIQDNTIQEGYAVDDGAALHFVGDSVHKAVSSRKQATAYHVHLQHKSIIEKPLEMYYLGDHQ